MITLFIGLLLQTQTPQGAMACISSNGDPINFAYDYCDCLAGFVENPLTGECVGLTCTPPEVPNGAGTGCEAPPPPECTPPQILDATGTACVDPPPPGGWAWTPIPGSEMDQWSPSNPNGVRVGDSEFPFCADIKCWVDPFAVWSSSGAVVTERQSIVVPAAGGHADRGGNEIYEFNLATNTWARVRDPDPLDSTIKSFQPDPNDSKRYDHGAPLISVDSCPGPSRDGLDTPQGQHLYGGVVFIPAQREILMTQKSGFCVNPTTADQAIRGRQTAWAISIDTWEARRILSIQTSTYPKLVYDPVTQYIYFMGDAYPAGRVDWHDTTDPAYPKVGEKATTYSYSYGNAGDIDPVNRKWAVFAPHTIREYELLPGGGIGSRQGNPLACNPNCQQSAVYHPVFEGFLAWQGGKLSTWKNGVHEDVLIPGGPPPQFQGQDDQRASLIWWPGDAIVPAGIYAWVNPRDGVYRLEFTP